MKLLEKKWDPFLKTYSSLIWNKSALDEYYHTHWKYFSSSSGSVENLKKVYLNSAPKSTKEKKLKYVFVKEQVKRASQWQLITMPHYCFSFLYLIFLSSIYHFIFNVTVKLEKMPRF